MHTQNLLGDPRASLLVTPPESRSDPLGAARVTLMGSATKVPSGEVSQVRELYLARHANASYWVDFDDFGFFRLALEDIYFVGGFGSMGWVTPKDYAAAAVDPLADQASSLIHEMNEQTDFHAVAPRPRIRQCGGAASDDDRAGSAGLSPSDQNSRSHAGGRVAFANPVRNASGGAEPASPVWGLRPNWVFKPCIRCSRWVNRSLLASCKIVLLNSVSHHHRGAHGDYER